MVINKVAITVFYSALIVVGIPGNILILATYRRKAKKVGTDIFIMGLASCDLCTSFINAIKIKIDVPSDLYCKINFYISSVLIYTTLAVTVAITVDRYLAVCWPMNRRPAKRTAGIVLFCCFVHACILRIALLYNSHYNEISKSCLQAFEVVRWATLWDYYVFPTWFTSAVGFSTVAYARILFALRRQARVRQELTGPIAPAGTHGATRSTNMDGKDPENSPAVEPTQQTSGPTSRANTVLGLGSKAERAPSGDIDPAQSVQSEVLRPEPLGTVANPELPSGQAIVTSANVRAPTAEGAAVEPSDGNHGNAGRNTERTLTVMLGVATIIFFVSWIPAIIIRFVPGDIVIASYVRSEVVHTIGGIFFRLSEFNAVINIFIYWRLNRRFRKDCRGVMADMKHALLRPCRKREIASS